MGKSEGTKAPETLRDLLTPELRGDFKYAYDRLISAGRKKGLTPNQAEAFAQDALLRAYERRDHFTPRPGKSWLNWLLTVAWNRFYDRIRTERCEKLLREEAAHRIPADTPTAIQETRLANAEATRRRAELVRAIPEDQRLVFWVWVEQNAGEISRQEAADKLGMTLSEYEASKKRVRRSLEKAMQSLGFQPADLFSTDFQHVPVAAKGRRPER